MFTFNIEFKTTKRLNDEVVYCTASDGRMYPISHMDGIEIYPNVNTDEDSMDFWVEQEILKYKRYKYDNTNNIVFEYERVKFVPSLGQQVYADLLRAKSVLIESGYRLFIDKDEK